MNFLVSLLADVKINPPTFKDAVTGATVNVGYSDLGQFVSNFLVLVFGIAILVVLIMLIYGAFEWIISGGDKEAVGKARTRIMNALIGLAVLAVAFAVAKVAGQFLGFPSLGNIPVPTPPPPTI